MSAWRTASWITARARSSDHSLSRRFVSYEIMTPASRATSTAANTASQADVLIAWLMPVT